MKAQFDTVLAKFDLPDDAQLGTTVEIVGVARVVALEEEPTVTVYPGAEHIPSWKAILVGEARLA